MWRCVVVAGLVACDPGEVICTPATEPSLCGGQLAQFCSVLRNEELIDQFVYWTDAKTGRELDTWQCSTAGCVEQVTPVLCECMAAEGLLDTGYMLGCE